MQENESKKKCFKEIEIKAWEEIEKLDHCYRKKKKEEAQPWIFRGQSFTEYSLSTSLERCLRNFPSYRQNPEKEEYCLCREFRRRFHQYSNNVPEEDDYLEWFSIMQHHGAPTRLLDFTYSVLIAAYFALEKAEGDCAIWAINAKWVLDQVLRLFPEESHERKFMTDLINEKSKDMFNKIFLPNDPKLRKKFIVPLNPFRLTERIMSRVTTIPHPKGFQGN